ncbi:AAA domain-containing protein [Trichoderma simmonsii]|uniref:AAA domain-containing protein n=1 Tax=Trichoderma simmonsii TaxID=1491479 RepID=A0A8G0L4G8_9HYPO|nr:AAA domain-containing protein [Trichoderma simmonsii]
MDDNPNHQQDRKQGADNDASCQEKSTVTLRREPIGRADKVFDKKTRKYRLHKRSQKQKSSEREKFERFVIVSARIITSQGLFSGRYEVSIRGRLLCEELSRIFPQEEFEFHRNRTLSDSSLMAMYHALPIIKNRLEGLKEGDETNDDLRFELNAGILFINEHWDHVIEDLHSTPKEFIKFNTLWTLFFPGCLLYGVDQLSEPRCYRLLSFDYKEEQDEVLFILEFDYLDHNGEQIGYRTGSHSIRSFKSAMPIQNLPLYPLSLHPDCDEVRKQLLIRAEKTLRLKGRHIQSYHGHALQGRGTSQKFNSNGRVMIDPVLYDTLYPSDVEPLIKAQNHHEGSSEFLNEGDLEEDQKLTMSSMVYGYCLRNKIWGAFAVPRLCDVTWDTSILDSVEIDPTRKSFLQTLVESHVASNMDSFDDIVKDKGKGLVGLLCGPPGVGKTLTAEAVAEVAKRPLLVVSSGEMGSYASTVESCLKAEIKLAEAWNAVLLLDEADVFMAERDDEHIERNAITSVFLRELEYYRGIILLTTNRLRSIDSAFQSRIHFCFHYDDLDVTAKALVWKTFLAKAGASEGVRVDITDEQRHILAENDFNGRQIKNIVSITRLYALQKKQPITLELVQMAAGFSQFTLPTKKRKRAVEDEQLSTKRQKDGDFSV